MSTNGIRWYVIGSAAFLAAGGVFIIAVLPILAPVLQPASYVFSYFDTSFRAAQGLPSDTYTPLFVSLVFHPRHWLDLYVGQAHIKAHGAQSRGDSLSSTPSL